jgi:type I restriction enzyme, S subunit
MSEWKTLTIPEFAEVISGSTPVTNILEYWDGDIEWVTPVDLSKIKSRFLKSTIRKISKKGLGNSSTGLIPANNVVMSSRAPIGYFAIPIKDFTTNQGCKSFKLFSQQDAEYHYYNFLFNIDYFKRFGSGSTFAEISKRDIEKLFFTIPTSLAEQRKIARILSTVDEVIQKTEAAIAKYKSIKSGMMRDLFTRGIDLKTGKLRPSFEEAPQLYRESELGMVPKEWEVVRLDKVSQNLDGKRRPIKEGDRSLIQGIYPYYGASGIIDYVNNFIFEEPLILLGEDGENVVSRNLPLAFIVNGKVWVNNHAHVLKPNADMDITYLCEYLEYLDYSDIVSGSAQPKITQNTLNKKLVKKTVLNEQTHIAKRIKGINKIITKEESCLSKHQQLKSALMSDLLTGKVRVKYEEEKVETQ